jgi:hypothetical protein
MMACGWALAVVLLVATSCGSSGGSGPVEASNAGGGDPADAAGEVVPAAADADETFDPAFLDGNAGGFPALDEPLLVSARSASWLESDDIVMGIVSESGEAQAYPVDQMAYHHVANTRLAGEPFVVTY